MPSGHSEVAFTVGGKVPANAVVLHGGIIRLDPYTDLYYDVLRFPDGNAKLTHYDPALVGPIVGELSAIPPGTDQTQVLESKLTQFEAKAKATGKKPVSLCITVQGR